LVPLGAALVDGPDACGASRATVNTSPRPPTRLGERAGLSRPPVRRVSLGDFGRARDVNVDAVFGEPEFADVVIPADVGMTLPPPLQLPQRILLGMTSTCSQMARRSKAQVSICINGKSVRASVDSQRYSPSAWTKRFVEARFMVD
jgi:hypothetical protein